MRFTVGKRELQGLLQRMLAVASGTKTVPILANVLITAAEGPEGVRGMLSMAATDMEAAVGARAACDCAEGGAVTVPAAVAAEIVRRMPDDAVIEAWTVDGVEKLHMRAGRFETQLQTLPVGDFPTMAGGTLPHVMTVPSSDLSRIIDNVAKAMSTESTRYYLNGIFLERATDPDGNPTLRGVATDGHRLMVSEVPMPGGEGPEGMPGVIVPRGSVALIRRMLDDSSPEVVVELSDTRLRVTAGPLTLTTKLVDGTYPDYRKIIPRTPDRPNAVLHATRKALAAAVARVGAVGSERSRPVMLHMERGVLTVKASSPEMGSAEEALEERDAQYAGPTVGVGFQVRYLEEMLSQMGERVEFHFAEEAGTGPALVLDPDHRGLTGLLMPMRM